MEHALALARKGAGLASPNPHVGCLIVRGATLYVNLEPCTHAGRTGPCTEAIIAAGIRRVVAAMQDPNPATSGRGFERLRAANIETVCSVLEDDARRLNQA